MLEANQYQLLVLTCRELPNLTNYRRCGFRLVWPNLLCLWPIQILLVCWPMDSVKQVDDRSSNR